MTSYASKDDYLRDALSRIEKDATLKTDLPLARLANIAQLAKEAGRVLNALDPPTILTQDPQRLRFTIKFKTQGRVLAEIGSIHDVDPITVSVWDVTNRIVEAEEFLERLTGLRVHIEAQ